MPSDLAMLSCVSSRAARNSLRGISSSILWARFSARARASGDIFCFRFLNGFAMISCPPFSRPPYAPHKSCPRVGHTAHTNDRRRSCLRQSAGSQRAADQTCKAPYTAVRRAVLVGWRSVAEAPNDYEILTWGAAYDKASLLVCHSERHRV